MKQYVTIDKRSKKAQKEYYSKQRWTWGELNPVTRGVPSGKTSLAFFSVICTNTTTHTVIHAIIPQTIIHPIIS